MPFPGSLSLYLLDFGIQERPSLGIIPLQALSKEQSPGLGGRRKSPAWGIKTFQANGAVRRGGILGKAPVSAASRCQPRVEPKEPLLGGCQPLAGSRLGFPGARAAQVSWSCCRWREGDGEREGGDPKSQGFRDRDGCGRAIPRAGGAAVPPWISNPRDSRIGINVGGPFPGWGGSCVPPQDHSEL